MEVWAFEGYGAAYALQELLTVKSDDMKGRHQIMNAILNKDTIVLGSPESFKVLLRELQAICLDVGIYSVNSFGKRMQIDLPTIDVEQILLKFFTKTIIRLGGPLLPRHE
eukprot:TRINITY_DN136_c1_g1_i3.p11 TRINITY_DN136_c1_g1~~TRINITY_DN136_c1_g1_i3.p11  ORF type:complete len:110 (-),score=10.18 TRINITY_DN136_c1_g1_i3:853-1182(-)